MTSEGEDELLVGQELLEQLRDVFDACDTEGHGMISLEELANISRSHVARGQVDQILEILGPGDKGPDKIDFEQFYQKFVQFMNNGVEEKEDYTEVEDNEAKQNSKMTYTPVEDSGVFNENLKRAFEKDTPLPSTTKQGHSRNTKRRSSQALQSGRIPLVNTSSEDEAEDSFDRQIASSLALARPLDIQPQFLVRGTSTRSTVRKNSNTSPNYSTSTRKFSTASRPSPTSTIRMSPILAPSGGSSFNSTVSSSPDSSPLSLHHSLPRSPEIKEVGVRLALGELERKMGEMSEMVDRQDDCDSLSSGRGSIRADLEEEINSSICLARKHGEERLQAERLRHADQMKAVERETNLERRNFQLRFEQYQEEQEGLRKEVEELKGKLTSVNLEKDHLEGQIMNLEKQNSCQASQDVEEEQKRKDKEEELMKTVQKLTVRVQSQDQFLAEANEDIIVLRSQVKHLKGERVKEGGRFKRFGGGRVAIVPDDVENEDPSDIRVKLQMKEEELRDQKKVNAELKQYVDKVMVNIMVKNPQMLENISKI